MKQLISIFNFSHIIKALNYAFCGIKTMSTNERAFKQEIILTMLVLPLGLYLGTTAVDKAVLISCWFLVLIVEAINSAIETIVDRISLEPHPVSKKIKDISAAAVLLALINASIVWMIILWK